jgi:tetratricopeptide (TPR) repeat protein
MQKITTLLLSLFLSNFLLGQSNYEKFKKLFEKDDTTKVKALLADWEKTNPNDPELYTAAINYYFSSSQKEVLSIDRNQNEKESFQLTDSTGNVSGYINSKIVFKKDKLSNAIKYANIGIQKFPNRLDIRFGKCYILQQIEDYKTLTKDLLETIEYSQVNKNNWLWSENVKQKDGEAFFVKNIHSYLKQLYDTENDDLLPNMIEIGDAALKYYKNNIEILSTTSVALLLTKNYDKAIGYLKQAETINPKDFIVLNNIAQAYKLKGDKTNAIKYYELTEKYGDAQAKVQAQQKIKELKK